jgi:uncharacterized protein YbcI
MHAALANEIVKIVAEATGRGATRSRAFTDGDAVVCVLEDGSTRAEQTLVDGGRAELAREHRSALQDLMEVRLTKCVERLTGRRVRAFVSGSSRLGEASVEVFLLEGAVEV